MREGGAFLARALSDGDDRLVSADEPLAGLQRQCGGDVPGTIAIPALLETVRKARRYGMKLARAMTAQGEGVAITAWVEVAPREDGEPGCTISVKEWRSEDLPAETANITARRKDEADRSLAELTARLDAAQNVLWAEARAQDLLLLEGAMQSGLGQNWLDFVDLEGAAEAGGPASWRLLHGALLRVRGSQRLWRASLFPQQAQGGQIAGFELCLTSDEAAPVAGTAKHHPEKQDDPIGLTPGPVGAEIAPVLRQPIARIIANAETIRTRMAGPLAGEYADYAADIAAAAQHLLALLDDLADLEVVESEEFTTAPDPIDLADVARRAAGILGVRARERGIIVDAPRAGETLPATAEFRRVLQVLLNLLGNAIRYAPTNSRVWIRLEQDAHRARVIVADQGPGLSPEEQARVFEKFERLGRSGDGGSGLGLYISRRMARAMGGDLSVESTPGQGARFILDLPGRE